MRGVIGEHRGQPVPDWGAWWPAWRKAWSENQDRRPYDSSPYAVDYLVPTPVFRQGLVGLEPVTIELDPVPEVGSMVALVECSYEEVTTRTFTQGDLGIAQVRTEGIVGPETGRRFLRRVIATDPSTLRVQLEAP